jgi:hypothetical protein
MKRPFQYSIICVVLLILTFVNAGKKSKSEEKPAWAKKDIRDYNDADLERLLDQWDVSINRNVFLYV